MLELLFYKNNLGFEDQKVNIKTRVVFLGNKFISHYREKQFTLIILKP